MARKARSVNLGAIKSMTFGVMPTFATFQKAFNREVAGSYYTIRNDRNLSGDYTARELYNLVKEIKEDWDGPGADTASAIMSTLGFEWV